MMTDQRKKRKMTQMFKIRNEFPSGEWSEIHVETFCEAVNWLKCRRNGRKLVKDTMTFYHNETLIMTEQL